MNTPDSQNVRPIEETPNAPLANRVRTFERQDARHVRRRLVFDEEGNDDPTPSANEETHIRVKVIEVKTVHGYPVHEEHVLTLELYDHHWPTNTTFNQPLDDGRLARRSYVHQQLQEIGHVSMNVNWDIDREDFDSEEEYKKRVNDMFRSITYIKL